MMPMNGTAGTTSCTDPASLKSLSKTGDGRWNALSDNLSSTEVACRDVNPTLANYDDDSRSDQSPQQTNVHSRSSSLEDSISSAMEYNTSSIRVAVRIRPFLSFEAGNQSVLEVPPGMSSSVHFVNFPEFTTQFNQTFTFDEMFDVKSDQFMVYRSAVAPLVQSCLEGYNATVLAYGQTGSGKTHTMLGNVHGSPAQKTLGQETVVPDAGIIPRTFHDLFSSLSLQKSRGSFDFSVKLQLLEIYGEDVRDLLGSTDSQKLQLRELGNDKEAEVLGAVEIPVSDAHDALLCVTRGTLRRVTRATAMNSASSRSHAVITLTIEQQIIGEKLSVHDPSDIITKRSKFRFVDLAGSERMKRTKAKGQGFKEGVNINQGLLVLGQVINALASVSETQSSNGHVNHAPKHIPYRDSKLTRMLRGSLGGDHKTLLIACVSPSSSNIEESLNTLRYANRAKNIKNNAVLNIHETASTKVLQELKDQVRMLAHELLRLKTCVRNQENFEEAISDEMLHELIAGGDTAKHNRPISDRRMASNVCDAGKPESLNVRKLHESNDMCLVSQQELDSNWLNHGEKTRDDSADISNVTSFSDYDELNIDDDVDDLASIVSMPVLTRDISLNSLSKETYQSIKGVYEEKMQHLSEQIATLEGECENLSIQLCRHETDLQRFEFVKSSFIEDLQQVNVKVAVAKSYLDDLSNLQVIPDEDAKGEASSRSLRVWRSSKSSSASHASSSTNTYYMEKLSKLEKHIRTRESEVNKLVQELRKLELDSQIFIDLEKDISNRLKKKEIYLAELHKKTQSPGVCDEEELSKLNSHYVKELEERDHLISELARLQGDGKAFSDLFHLLSEDRVTKETHLNKYKKKHYDLARSVGLPSPHGDHNCDETGGGDDDSCSVTSNLTFSSSFESEPSHTRSVATITRSMYDQKVAAAERDIAKYEAEKALIQADLAKFQDDAVSFSSLSDAIKSKLQSREKHLQILKKNQADFKESLSKQEKELIRLLSK